MGSYLDIRLNQVFYARQVNEERVDPNYSGMHKIVSVVYTVDRWYIHCARHVCGVRCQLSDASMQESEDMICGALSRPYKKTWHAGSHHLRVLSEQVVAQSRQQQHVQHGSICSASLGYSDW